MATQDINITFCRRLLMLTMVDVRKHTSKAERKNSWTWHCGYRDQWEFHGPDDFFWEGRADNGYDARDKGWSAYLKKLGVKGYTE